MSLPGLDIDEKRIITSTGALELSKVPEHLVLVGGGVIGLEMGSVWKRLGAKVTVVEFTDAIAAGADIEVAKTFRRSLEQQGLTFRMKSKVLGVDKNGEKLTVNVQDIVKNSTDKVSWLAHN